MVPSVNTKTDPSPVSEFRPNGGDSQEPLALETTVTVTGARPGEAGSKRDLFTEETQTVLVFENGAVIRLSAAVADGQLLFLSHKKTGKEVVAQVIRKRSFRPTNCYVDLEFTELCAGFWGVEFPKEAKPASVVSASKAFSEAEEADSVPAKAAAAPSMREVERLKHEVAELQTQLRSLLKTPPAVPQYAMRAGAPNVPPPQPGEKAALEIRAHIAKKEVEQQLEELIAQEKKQDQENTAAEASQSAPKRKTRAQKKDVIAAPKPVEPNGHKKWILAVASMVLIAACGSAAYQFGVLDDMVSKAVRKAPSRPPVYGNVPAGRPSSTTAASSAVGTDANASSVTTEKPSPAPENTAPTAEHSAEAKSSKESEAMSAADAKATTEAKPSLASRVSAYFSKSKSSEGPRAGEAPVSTAPEAATDAPAKSGESIPTAAESGSDFVAPKLVRSVKPVAPAEATQNYITGNVKMDTVIDATGHVKSVRVVSGPDKLRDAAMNSVKQYLYEPAKKGGKAVPAHVEVSLQFWYEP